VKVNKYLFNVSGMFSFVSILLLLVGNISVPSIQPINAQLQGLENNQTDTSQGITKIIQISVGQEEEVYRWSNIQGTNPTLKVLTNTNNTVQIQNPTNEKHEMIIESKGNEVASSGDIVRHSSGQLFFSPNSTGTFEYHCEYHPDTMKGTVLADRQ
jgi:Cupredoxin-like domain